MKPVTTALTIGCATFVLLLTLWHTERSTPLATGLEASDPRGLRAGKNFITTRVYSLEDDRRVLIDSLDRSCGRVGRFARFCHHTAIARRRSRKWGEPGFDVSKGYRSTQMDS